MYRRAILWIVIALVFAGMTIPPLITGILSLDSQCTGIITARAWMITHSILYILFFTCLLPIIINLQISMGYYKTRLIPKSTIASISCVVLVLALACIMWMSFGAELYNKCVEPEKTIILVYTILGGFISILTCIIIIGIVIESC